MLFHPTVKGLKAGPRGFLLEKLGSGFIGRVVHHDHQHRLGPASLKPIVMRPVQLHHLPQARLALPPLPMLLPPPPRLPETFLHQPAPQRIVIHLQPILPLQILRRQRRAKIRIPAPVTGQHPGPQRGVRAPPAGAATQTMHQSGIAFLFVTPPHPFSLAVTQNHHLGGLPQRQLSMLDLLHDS
jgi:hypothetical protein